jgi:hypothetical protein
VGIDLRLTTRFDICLRPQFCPSSLNLCKIERWNSRMLIDSVGTNLLNTVRRNRQPAGCGLFCASGMSSGCVLGSHARLLESLTAHILSQDSHLIPTTFNNLTHAFSLVDSRFLW